MRKTVPCQLIFLAFALPTFLSSCSKQLGIAGCEPNPAQNLLEVMNQARAKEGAPPLWANESLTKAAQPHAQAVGEGKAEGHIGPDGSDPLQRIEGAGYRPRAFGENVAVGSLNPEVVVSAWLASPAHRAILLDPSFQEVGLGGVLNPDRPVWVADFGSETDPPKTRCHSWPNQSRQSERPQSSPENLF